MYDLTCKQKECEHMVRITSVEGVETTCIKCGFPFYTLNRDTITNRYIARKARVEAKIRHDLMRDLIKELKWFTLR